MTDWHVCINLILILTLNWSVSDGVTGVSLNRAGFALVPIMFIMSFFRIYLLIYWHVGDFLGMLSWFVLSIHKFTLILAPEPSSISRTLAPPRPSNIIYTLLNHLIDLSSSSWSYPTKINTRETYLSPSQLCWMPPGRSQAQRSSASRHQHVAILFHHLHNCPPELLQSDHYFCPVVELWIRTHSSFHTDIVVQVLWRFFE